MLLSPAMQRCSAEYKDQPRVSETSVSPCASSKARMRSGRLVSELVLDRGNRTPCSSMRILSFFPASKSLLSATRVSPKKPSELGQLTGGNLRFEIRYRVILT